MAEKVDLGFIGDFEDWELESRQFPSKVGGRPAWLDLKNLPKPSQLACEECKRPLTFLAQLYCPDDTVASAFHRSLLVFICRTAACWSQSTASTASAVVVVLRSQLPRDNSFYPFQPPQDNPGWGADIAVEAHSAVCPVCGGMADKLCGRCRGVSYCSELHQRAHWKLGHKGECREGGLGAAQGVKDKTNSWLLKQMGLDMEKEPEEEEEGSNEVEEMKKFENLAEKGETGCLENEVDLEEVEKGQVEDKTFSNWSKRVKRAPGQVIRYHRGGKPLWCSSSQPVGSVPNCGVCGAKRTFEFQVMPQLLHEVGLGLDVEDGPDWGSIYVYTCSASCTPSGYVREWVVTAQFDNINLPVT